MSAEVTFLPDGKTVRVRPGTTVLEAARKGLVPIRSRCGGQASCLMCKVTVEEPRGLSPLGEKEKNKLGSLAASGVRLACQARILGRAEVSVPEDPLKAAVRKQLAKGREEANEADDM